MEDPRESNLVSKPELPSHSCRSGWGHIGCIAKGNVCWHHPYVNNQTAHPPSEWKHSMATTLSSHLHVCYISTPELKFTVTLSLFTHFWVAHACKQLAQTFRFPSKTTLCSSKFWIGFKCFSSFWSITVREIFTVPWRQNIPIFQRSCHVWFVIYKAEKELSPEFAFHHIQAAHKLLHTVQHVPWCNAVQSLQTLFFLPTTQLSHHAAPRAALGTCWPHFTQLFLVVWSLFLQRWAQGLKNRE